MKTDGEFVEMDTYSFMTTKPNDVVKPIHPSRMPVMLSTAEDFDTWLNGSPEDAFELACPFPSEKMLIVHKGEKQDRY